MQEGTEDRLEQVLTILKEQVVHRPKNTLRTLSSSLIYYVAYSLNTPAVILNLSPLILSVLYCVAS